MSTENRVNLELDQYRRIGIKDIISMLKGLRSEAVIRIVQASEVSDNAQGPDINNESNNMERTYLHEQCENRMNERTKQNKANQSDMN